MLVHCLITTRSTSVADNNSIQYNNIISIIILPIHVGQPFPAMCTFRRAATERRYEWARIVVLKRKQLGTAWRLVADTAIILLLQYYRRLVFFNTT